MAGMDFLSSLLNKARQYAPTKHGVNSAGEAILHAPFDAAGFLGDLLTSPIQHLPSDARLLRHLLTGNTNAARQEIVNQQKHPQPGLVSPYVNALHDLIHKDTAAPTTTTEKYLDAGIRGGPAGIASQVAQDTVSDKNPYKPAIVDAAGLAGMVVPGMIGRRSAPESISLSKDIVPYKKPNVAEDGTPAMGQFASQKDAAMHMRANGFTPATHDIVAHGDDSYSVVPKAPSSFNINEATADVPQNIDLSEEQPSAPPAPPVEQAPEVSEAPTAPDGLPGNGSVPPIDPQEIGRIMGNPEGAWDGVTPPDPRGLANLPEEEPQAPAEPTYMHPPVVQMAMNNAEPQPFQLPPEEDPTAAAAEEFQATPGVNARRMAKMLGPQLYGDPSNMGPVSVKEVLQNSFDAIKDAMAKHGLEQGQIHITSDPANRELTMHDNGIGMHPETLGGKFLQIAGTGKEGDNASGGFGIAKMLFLYGNKKLHVTTMRDGKVSELHTTGEQLFDALEDPSKAPKIQVRPANEADHVDFPHGHGTRIKMTIPSHFKDPMSGEDREIDFPRWDHDVHSLGHSPMFAPIKVHWNGYQVPGIGDDFPAHKYGQLAHVKSGWGNADIYVSNAPDHKYGDNLHVLSNGLHQFSKKLGKNPGDPWSEPLPYKFYVDLHPKVKPEDAGYPFNFNRQSLTEGANKELHGVLDYIQKLYAHKSLGDEAKSFGSMYYITPGTGEHSDPVDMKPVMPVITDGLRGIQPGDEVTVRDGRMFVNGKELPALTPDELKNSVPSHKELMINPALIDTQRIMVHSNADVHLPESHEGRDGEEEFRSGEEGGVDIIGHMRQEFGPEFDEFQHDVGSIFKDLRDMVSELDSSYRDLQNQAVGISYDPKYRGVSIRVPFSGSFINPLVPRGSAPREYGAGLLGTMIHELAHFKVRSHNADFPAEMQELHLRLYGNEEFPKWFEQAVNDLAQYKDIIEYGRRLFDEKYVKARSDSFKDGVRDDRPEGSDEGDASGVSREGRGGQDPSGVSEGAAQEYPSIGPRDSTGTRSGPRGQKAVIRKLTDILEQGKPLRLENSARISAERSARLKAAIAARQGKGGREALYAQLKALKGEMSQARIAPLTSHFTPEEINSLIDHVANNPKLSGYDSIRAQVALDKLFGKEYGELPTEGELKLLSQVLPHSLIRALMNDEQGSVSSEWIAKYTDPVTQVTGIPRALKTIGDFGVAFRQCIPLIGTKAYWTSMKEIFKGMTSEKMFQKSWEQITSDPDYFWMQVGGVAFSNLNHHDLSKREEFAPSPLAEKLPLVRRSERGYTGYLNTVRYHTFKRLLNDARKVGVDPTTDTAQIKEIGKFVNMMTGRGDLGKAGNQAAPFLSSMFFAPRLAFSRVQLMLQAATFWRLPKYLRKELAKGMISYAVYMGTILGLANNVGSHFGVHVEMDPRSTEFARIQVGDTYFDATGSFQPYVRTFWQFVTDSKKNASGEVQPLGQKYGQPSRLELVTNFVEGKASPNAAFLMDMMRGPDFEHPKDITGEVHPFSDFNKDDWNKNPLVNLVMPMGVGAGIEAGQHYGAKSVLPYAAGLAETFGIGAKTYTPRVPKDRSKKEFDDFSSKSEFGGGFGKDDFQ